MAQSTSIAGKTCPVGTLTKRITKLYNQSVAGKDGQTITKYYIECLEINKDNTEPFQYYSPKCENSDINISAKNVTLKSGIPQKQFHCSR